MSSNEYNCFDFKMVKDSVKSLRGMGWGALSPGCSTAGVLHCDRCGSIAHFARPDDQSDGR